MRRGYSSKSGCGSGRARFQRPQQNRPVAAFGQAATGRACKCLARGTANRRPLARAKFRWCPAIMGEACAGLRPGLLRQVVRKRVVFDAGGSSPTRHEGRFTDTPPGLAYGASTPRLMHEAASCGRGVLALSLVVGAVFDVNAGLARAVDRLIRASDERTGYGINQIVALQAVETVSQLIPFHTRHHCAFSEDRPWRSAQGSVRSLGAMFPA